VTAAGDVEITWSAEAGRTYQLQYRNSVAGTPWVDVENVLANDGVARATNRAGSISARFYRIERIDP
jgi:hypothetical protein